jgi:hypothetical protein
LSRTTIAPILANYYIRLKSQTGTTVAIFDNFERVHIEKKLNDVGNYTLTFSDDDDDRYNLFQLDCQIELWRSCPGVGLGWYREFAGFHRHWGYSVDDKGKRGFTSSGPDYNDLLARSTVAYKAGTIRSDKNEASETAMKGYVEENCGPTADQTIVGRLYTGGFTCLTVEPNSGAGEIWTGSRAFDNVLDVVKDIADFSGIDFEVYGKEDGKYIFRTSVGQLGKDRSITPTTTFTGLNSFGNTPILFSIDKGNVKSLDFSIDRTKEANIVIVPGRGDLSTRYVISVYDATLIDDSPINKREITRTPGSYDDDYETYSLTVAGKEALQENRPITTAKFVPIQSYSNFYGVDYWFGDRITFRHKGWSVNKKISGVTLEVSEGKENIELEFTDETK